MEGRKAEGRKEGRKEARKQARKEAFRKKLLGTSLKDLGSGKCLKGLMMGLENRICQPAMGQFPDEERKYTDKETGSQGWRALAQGAGRRAGRLWGATWAGVGLPRETER